MSLRPNRASSAANGAGGTPSYGGYTPGGYTTAGGTAGSTSYYAQGTASTASPYGSSQGGYGNGSGYQYQGYGGGGSSTGGAYGGYSGGTSYGTPSADDKDKRSKRNKAGGGSGSNIPALLCGALAVLFFISTLHYRGKAYQVTRLLNVDTIQEAITTYNKVHNDLNQVRREKRELQRKLEAEMEDWEARRHHLHNEMEEVKHAHDHVQAKLEDHHYEAEERREHMKSRDEAWANTVEILQDYTQRESHRMAVDRFGHGPHHVRFTVLLPSDHDQKPRSFVVECASIDIMPHAVYLFLEQVVHGLWNDAWFYLNGPHVLQGGPQVEDEHEEGHAALQRFRDLGLDHLAFPEYSKEFPHFKFTLGFTGRPGGPDFYINKMDNTESHGPGGQHQHSLEEFADPCFAKVIDGFETLEMIFHERTYPEDHEWGWFYEHPVHIIGATLLEEMAVPVQTDEHYYHDGSDHTHSHEAHADEHHYHGDEHHYHDDEHSHHGHADEHHYDGDEHSHHGHTDEHHYHGDEHHYHEDEHSHHGHTDEHHYHGDEHSHHYHDDHPHDDYYGHSEGHDSHEATGHHNEHEKVARKPHRPPKLDHMEHQVQP